MKFKAKKFIFITLLLFTVAFIGLYISSAKGSTENTQTSSSYITLSSFSLPISKNNKKKYKIALLRINDTDEKIISISKNGKTIEYIKLPKTDEEIKNLSVQLEIAENGFNIITSWGGGKNYYGDTFKFVIEKNKFYLFEITSKESQLDSDKELVETKKIDPKIPFKSFDIKKYLLK